MAKDLTDIRSLARSYTDKAINVLAGIMQQPKSPDAARVAAANSLLDRGWGKAMQNSTVIIEKRDATDWTRDELVAFLDDAKAGGNGAAKTNGRTIEPDSVH